MDLLLRKTKQLEQQIDNYLELVVKGAQVFREGLQCYLDLNLDQFTEQVEQLDLLEGQGDTLRRTIETTLYLETLIPESRGDVLGLMESTDKVLNRLANTISQFGVEHPVILEPWKIYFKDLVDVVAHSVESMVVAIRSYFTENEKVRDNINRVMFFEKESDKLSDKIKRMVYDSDIDLAHKNHVRYFVYHIELIADDAEDVTDRLTIATIKRRL
jgi:uncharacterized protein